MLKDIALVVFVVCCGAFALKFGFYDLIEIDGSLKNIAPFLNFFANCYLFAVYTFLPGFVAVLIYDKICHGSIAYSKF